MSKGNVKRWAFNLFLKSVMSETVRKSAGREFHAAGPGKRIPLNAKLLIKSCPYR